MMHLAHRMESRKHSSDYYHCLSLWPGHYVKFINILLKEREVALASVSKWLEHQPTQ